MLRAGRERSWMTCAEASLDGAAAGAGAGHAGWTELDLAGLEAGSVAVEPFVVVVSPTRYLPAPLAQPLLKGFKYFFISCCFQNTHPHTHTQINCPQILCPFTSPPLHLLPPFRQSRVTTALFNSFHFKFRIDHSLLVATCNVLRMRTPWVSTAPAPYS